VVVALILEIDSMKKGALLASTALLLFSSSAMANNVTARKAAPVAPAVPVFTWSGFYAGVNAGINWSNRNVNTSYVDTDLADQMTPSEIAYLNPLPYGNSRTGFIGGIQLGYNYQINQLVLGAEADFMGAALSKTSRTSVTTDAMWGIAGEAGYSTFSTKIQQNWLGTVRARLGYAVDRFMVYGTGGFAYGNVKSTSATTAIYPAGNDVFAEGLESWAGSKSQTKLGYAIGAGIEYAITNNWTIRGEYLYYNLGQITNVSLPTTMTFSQSTTANDSTNVGRNKTTVDGNIVRLALSYKF
jgi:outer membrane immunogenic protein